MSFQLVVRYGEILFVKSRFLPHCSPHYHPGGVYFGWVEMWSISLFSEWCNPANET